MPPVPPRLPVDAPAAAAVYAGFKLDGFFPEFNEELCGKLFPRSGVVRYRAGEKIVAQGESGRDLFLILAGGAVVRRRNGERAEDVGRIGPGELVGEMALLADGVRTACVVCETDVAAYALVYEDVGYVLKHNPELARHLEALSQRRASP